MLVTPGDATPFGVDVLDAGGVLVDADVPAFVDPHAVTSKATMATGTIMRRRQARAVNLLPLADHRHIDLVASMFPLRFLCYLMRSEYR